MLPSSGEEIKILIMLGSFVFGPLVQWLRFSVRNGPKRVDISILSPEEGSRSCLRNVVFSTDRSVS
jgi:hypothetical protein